MKRHPSTPCYTPSELEEYEACPFGFYVKHILRIGPPPEPEPELTPAEVGTLLHRVLERLLKTQGGVLEEIIGQEFASIQRNRGHLVPALVERQRDRVERTLKSFLEAEAQRGRAGPLEPAYFEWSFGKNGPPLEIADGKEPIRIRGRVDRIDVDRERKFFLVIDYKTGSGKISGNQIVKGGRLQLPLYILAVGRLLLPDYRPIGGLYYHLSDLSLDSGLVHAERIPEGIRPRPSSVAPEPRWNDLFRRAEEKVRVLAGKIRAEEFPPAPEPCQPWCPYQDLCRLRSVTKKTGS